MNFKLLTVYLVLAVFISSFSCSNSSKRSRKPVVSISVQSVNKKILFGDDLQVRISVKLKDGDLSETRLYLDTLLLTSEKQPEFNYTIKKFDRVGKYNIKAVSRTGDGIEGVYYKNFEVFSDQTPEMMTYEIVKTYPHNTKFFTEGLEISNGMVWEGTGEYGQSGIYKTNINTGKILQSLELDDQYFGEGITVMNNKIYQLTYKTKLGFVYNLETLEKIDSFSFSSAEGWGLTNDGQYLIMGDGSNVLTYIDPKTYQPVKKLQVYSDKNAVVYLNELEYSDGYIYANIYTTNLIAKIDATTGKVIQKIDLEGILSMNSDKQVDVLNGIAIDQATKKMYVTGKYYPQLFEIRIVKKG
jgi:glutaminyl-peptide cyclotransferase